MVNRKTSETVSSAGKGMAWANWEYKGDFGIFEWFPAQKSSGAPDGELIDALPNRH